MTNRDEFWEIANNRQVRGVSLHCWQDKFDFKKNLGTIAWAVDQLGLWPARVEIYHNQKSRAKVDRWKGKADANLDGFKSIEAVSVMSARRPKMETLDIALRSFHFIQSFYDPRRIKIYFEGCSDYLTFDLVDNVLGRLLNVVTPAYGFSAPETKGRCYWFHAGQPTSGMSDVQNERVNAHDQIRHLGPKSKESLANRLLDVFELNILNQSHLELEVAGTTLKDWIGSGNHGSLRQLKPGVFAWLVPDAIRPAIRESFLKAGCLTVPI